VLALIGAMMLAAAPVAGTACPGHPHSTPTSRQTAVPAFGGTRIGTISYATTAPLADREVALTFDDGPDGEHTRQVLEILQRHCIRATFFLVGQEVRDDPDTVRAIAAAGHTLGAHSQTHPDSLPALPAEMARKEVTDSFEEIRTALAPAPVDEQRRLQRFFRYPSLIRSEEMDAWLAGQGYAVISADLDADDWDSLASEEILARAILRTDARRGGILLLHDFNPEMVAVLDRILVALENRGYRFVQLVQAD
jgi:peptidoglycan/xylan/chitin deacetylase (PgdA/CDA1 family)